jgi:hypothetical protein
MASYEYASKNRILVKPLIMYRKSFSNKWMGKENCTYNGDKYRVTRVSKAR